MRPIDADKIDYTMASIYWGKDEDGNDVYRRTAIAIESEIDELPTINADDYFDAVDRIKPCPNCRYTHLHKMSSENGNTPWISVKDRLPKHNETVLCLCHANIYEVLVWDNREREWYHDIEHSYLETFVTHWMPLPMPPEEG